mgnify:FL=1|tara:strand:+ start:2256 stop:2690 length:435 start_codon:yes stop_codon:yes gene_type:complete
MKVKKYKSGGKTGDPKKKKDDSSTKPKWRYAYPNQAPKKMQTKRGAVGRPMSNEFRKKMNKYGKGSQADVEMRFYSNKTMPEHTRALQRSKEVPNKALAKKTEDFGTYGKKTYRSGNPGGLKGKTQGKGGNVGKGIKPKRKRRR